MRRVWGTHVYRTCLLLMVMTSLAASSTMPLISLYLVKDLKGSLPIAGLYYTCQAVPALALGVLLGRWSDRWRTRLPLLRTALLWSTLGWLLFAAAPAPWLALVAGALFISVGGVVMGQTFAMLADAMTENGETQRELINTVVRTGWSFGFVFGPVLGTGLAAAIGFRHTFAAAACLYLLCQIPLLSLRVVIPEAIRGGAGADRGGANALLLSFTALCALAVSGQAIKNTYLPIDVTVHLKSSMQTYGTIVAVSPIVEVVVMPLSGVLAQKIAVGRLIAAGLILAVVEYLILSESTMIWQFYMTQAMDACVVAAIMGLGVTYAQRLSPHHPGTANGIFFSMFSVASILGGLIGSASVPVLGVPHIFLIPAALCAAMWLVFLGIDRRVTRG